MSIFRRVVKTQETDFITNVLVLNECEDVAVYAAEIYKNEKYN